MQHVLQFVFITWPILVCKFNLHFNLYKENQFKECIWITFDWLHGWDVTETWRDDEFSSKFKCISSVFLFVALMYYMSWQFNYHTGMAGFAWLHAWALSAPFVTFAPWLACEIICTHWQSPSTFQCLRKACQFALPNLRPYLTCCNPPLLVCSCLWSCLLM